MHCMTIAQVQASLSTAYNDFVNSEIVSGVVTWGSRQVEWLQTTANAYYPKFIEAMQYYKKAASPQIDQMLIFVQTHHVFFIAGASAVALAIIFARYISSEDKAGSLGFPTKVMGERAP